MSCTPRFKYLCHQFKLSDWLGMDPGSLSSCFPFCAKEVGPQLLRVLPGLTIQDSMWCPTGLLPSLILSTYLSCIVLPIRPEIPYGRMSALPPNRCKQKSQRGQSPTVIRPWDPKGIRLSIIVRNQRLKLTTIFLLMNASCSWLGQVEEVYKPEAYKWVDGSTNLPSCNRHR